MIFKPLIAKKMNELPPVPNLSIKKVLDRRDKLTGALTGYLGHKLTEGQYESFKHTLIEALPQGIPVTAIENSIKNLAGKTLSDKDLLNFCWRIAANMDSLWNSQPVLEWVYQKDFEWVPVEIAEIYVVKFNGKIKNQLIFQSLAGSIAPKTLIQYWSFEKTSYLATFRDDKNNGFGFSRSRLNKRGDQTGRNLFLDYRQYGGLRCFLLIDPYKSKIQNAPVAIEVGHNGATTSYNTNLIVKRNRLINPCLKGYGHDIECFHCPYGSDKCEIATHPRTYSMIKCKDCNKPYYCDSGDNLYGTICISCAAVRRRE